MSAAVRTPPPHVIWHELECGGYTADLPLWHELAAAGRGAILDIGAGSGRVAVPLARAGHEVVALDRDAGLLAELARRPGGDSVTTVCADARDFALGRRFALCIVPMQSIQLFGGRASRAAFLRRAREHLAAHGVLAVAISPRLEGFGPHEAADFPPDACERDGIRYASRPVAARDEGSHFVLERAREIVDADGRRTSELSVERLARLGVRQLTQEGRDAGLRALPTRRVAATDDYVASEIAMLGA